MIWQMLAIWSLLLLPFLNSAWTSGSSWFIFCWSLALSILSITFLVCKMKIIVVWFEHSLAFPFFGIGMKIDLFQFCGHCWVFQIFRHIECSTFITSSFRIWNSSTGIPSPVDYFWIWELTGILKYSPKYGFSSFIFSFHIFHSGWLTFPFLWF